MHGENMKLIQLILMTAILLSGSVLSSNPVQGRKEVRRKMEVFLTGHRYVQIYTANMPSNYNSCLCLSHVSQLAHKANS